MRAWLVASYLANLAVAAALLRRSPHGVLPVAGLVALNTLLLALVLLAPSLLRRLPPRWLSIPRPDYWLRPEHRPEAERRLQARLRSFGAVTFAFLLVCSLCVLHVPRAPAPESWQRADFPVRGAFQPPPPPARVAWEPVALHGAAILFLLYATRWYFGSLRDFRVTKPETAAGEPADAGPAP
jgi:hypothetical protein